MISPLTEVLALAKKSKRAVIAPNFVNLNMASAYLKTAQRLQAPVILSWHFSFLPFMEVADFQRFTAILREEAQRASVPVVLHLDHTSDLGEIGIALEAGFNSVMFDGSTLPLAENIAISQRVVAIARQHGASVEAELGHVTGYEGGGSSDTELTLTDPAQAVEFVNKTGVDALAVSIGTVHGPYKGEPKLDLGLVEEISSRVKTPLVLHGTSGLSRELIQQAVAHGISKINVFTDLLNVLADREQGKPNDYLSLLKDLSSGWDSKLSSYFEMTGSGPNGLL